MGTTTGAMADQLPRSGNSSGEARVEARTVGPWASQLGFETGCHLVAPEYGCPWWTPYWPSREAAAEGVDHLADPATGLDRKWAAVTRAASSDERA